MIISEVGLKSFEDMLGIFKNYSILSDKNKILLTFSPSMAILRLLKSIPSFEKAHSACVDVALTAKYFLANLASKGYLELFVLKKSVRGLR